MTFKSHLRWSNPSAEQLQLFRPKKKKFKWHFWLTSRALMIQLSFIFLIANWIFDDQVSLMIKDKTLAIDLNWNDFVDLKFLVNIWRNQIFELIERLKKFGTGITFWIPFQRNVISKKSDFSRKVLTNEIQSFWAHKSLWRKSNVLSVASVFKEIILLF